jgi:predicted nucleic acid-binding protein
MKPLRIYVDTSVFGGCFDKPFINESVKIFNAIRQGRFILVYSELVNRELLAAPARVKALSETLPPEYVEEVQFTQAAEELRDAYLAAGILRPDSIMDASHVATATIHRTDAIVSWNFAHIVKLEKMRLYNQINLQNGYGYLQIVSPREVLSDEEN